MDRKQIDLNCDLGEGGGNDSQLMQYISSCNIACGGHFGDEESVARAVDAAIENGVAIGAHPSYPNKSDFGRKSMEISPSALKETVYEQILNVKKATERRNYTLHHVKAHGALYHDLNHNQQLAEAFLGAVAQVDNNLSIYAPPQSCLHRLSKGRITVHVEGFADRAYGEGYYLLPRQFPGSVLTDKVEVAKQALYMIEENRVPHSGKTTATVQFDTLCVHSDNENSLQILRHLKKELELKKIEMKAL